MATYRIEKMREDIAAIRKEYSEDFNTTARMTRARAMETLRPGVDFIPKDNVIYGDNNREKFNERTYDYRQRGREVIANAKRSLDAEIGKAPSADAVNMVSMLSMRSSVSPEDIESALNTYGENYSSYEAIREIAKKNNIFVDPHPLTRERDAIESYSNMVERMTLNNAEKRGEADPVRQSFYEANT